MTKTDIFINKQFFLLEEGKLKRKHLPLQSYLLLNADTLI